MRLERNDDVVLRTELGRIVGASHMRNLLRAFDLQPDAVSAHRGEMRAARHEAHVGAGLREADAEKAADRARPENRHLHAATRY